MMDGWMEIKENIEDKEGRRETGKWIRNDGAVMCESSAGHL
jgi:hypothetical protein